MNYFPGKFIRSFEVLNSINKNKYMTDPQNKDFKTAIVPMLSVRNGVTAIEFYKHAFLYN